MATTQQVLDWPASDNSQHAPPHTESKPAPRRHSGRTDFTVDLAAIAVAMAGFMLPLGAHSHTVLMNADLPLAALAIATILASLYFAGVWDSRGQSCRSSSIAPLRRGYFWAIATLAILWVVLDIEKRHLWILCALPVALALSMLARGLLIAVAASRLGNSPRPISAMIVGDRAGLSAFLAQRQSSQLSHVRLDAACLTNEPQAAHTPESIGSVPIAGTESDLVDLVRHHSYETIVLLPSAGWSSEQIRALMWQMEGTSVDVLIAPPLMDVASDRLRVATVAGIPVLHVSPRRFGTPSHAAKVAFDRLAAIAGIVLLLPILAVIALCIRLSSKGPALYRQTRIGLDRKPFTIYKFRTMTQDAETLLQDLNDRNDGAGPLFKCFEDPRVTRVGRVLRRYSIDELPQLFNVALGSMSLIGPRPPLPTQVDQYHRTEEHRRLLVRPGMTGLWQVSGRSDLSWSETVRHDLYYVENWTMRLDIEILWKTAGAVTSGRGAY